MASFADIFPPIETALELEPEEMAIFVLRHLGTLEKINRFNYTSDRSEAVRAYAGEEHRVAFAHRLMEAWVWLEREMLIAPSPVAQADWTFLTRRGRRLLESADFAAHRKASLLPAEYLDPSLSRKVRPLFIRGDYDTAVFQAFKEVEVRVRRTAGFPDSLIGQKLMRESFRPEGGPLTDVSADSGERQGVADLFAGAMAIFKNPSSHRDIDLADPKEAADLIHFANQLLRIVDRRSSPPSSNRTGETAGSSEPAEVSE